MLLLVRFCRWPDLLLEDEKHALAAPKLLPLFQCSHATLKLSVSTNQGQKQRRLNQMTHMWHTNTESATGKQIKQVKSPFPLWWACCTCGVDFVFFPMLLFIIQCWHPLSLCVCVLAFKVAWGSLWLFVKLTSSKGQHLNQLCFILIILVAITQMSFHNESF